MATLLSNPDPAFKGKLESSESFLKRSNASRFPRILLLSDDAPSLPASLLEQVTIADSDALIKRDLDSATEMLMRADACAIPDVFIHLFTDQRSVMRGIKAVWNTRIRNNYRPRPVYF